MNRLTLQWCNWSGVAFVAMWMIGFLFFAHVVPPPSPNDTAAQIAEFFRGHTGGIRFGILLTLYVSPFYATWSGAIAVQMKRMAGVHPVLGDVQLLLGGLTVLVFMIPALLLEVAAFRPSRSAELIQALDDIPWLMFIGMGATAILQPALIAVATLMDRSDDPVFPRWVGWLNVWTVLLFLPGPVCVFFKTGPLAWDGIFPWWIPFIVFAVWMVIMIVVVHQSINRTARATAPSANADPELAQQIAKILEAKLVDLRRDVTRSAVDRD